MGTINENPPVSWVILTLASAGVGIGWFFTWSRFSPWPVVGYVGSALCFAVPVVVGIVAGVKRRRLETNTE
jgi:hypothetical protein